MPLTAIWQSYLQHYAKLTPQTNTQMAAFYFSSPPPPPLHTLPPPACVDGSSVIPFAAEQHVSHSKVTQSTHFPTVHYTLPWKLE